MLRSLICVCLLMWAATAMAVAPHVELKQEGDQVLVSIDGELFTSYHTAKTQPKPFFSPVLSPAGQQFTRPLENPVDHPHHKGIWLSIDEVNDIKFWAEKGKIENQSVELLVSTGNPAKMKVVNHWQGEDGQPVLIETTTIGIWANRLFTYDIQLTAGKEPVKFGDTKEGLFGIRLADPLREKVGGLVENAEEKKTTKECWGQESAWVDYYGKLGEETCGVAIFDHPQNFRKSRYHVRDYGLFTISPFGQKSYTNGMLPEIPTQLEAGKSLRLRYGLYLHPGDTRAGKVAEAYTMFLNATKD